MARKNSAATSRFIRAIGPRPRPARCRQPARLQHVPQRAVRGVEETQPELVYHAARAHNRGMIDFCSVDAGCCRPSTYHSPTSTPRRQWPARRSRWARPRCSCRPPVRRVTHRARHLGLDPVWATAQDAGIPVVFHVGGEGDHFNHDYFSNGLPIPPDFHGGEENFRSVDYMGIPHPVMLTMATMIFDGVLDRFPRLRLGESSSGRCRSRVGSTRWSRRSRPSPDTRSVSARLECGRPSTCTARSERPPIRPTTSGGSRTARSRHLSVLVGLPPRRRRPQTVRALRALAGRRQRSRAAALLPRQLRRLDRRTGTQTRGGSLTAQAIEGRGRRPAARSGSSTTTMLAIGSLPIAPWRRPRRPSPVPRRRWRRTASRPAPAYRPRARPASHRWWSAAGVAM